MTALLLALSLADAQQAIATDYVLEQRSE